MRNNVHVPVVEAHLYVPIVESQTDKNPSYNLAVVMFG